MKSAGVYAGSSEGISIAEVESSGNAIGIELENTLHSEVYASHVYDNGIGVFVALQPHLPSKISLYNQVYDNLIDDNNLESVMPQGPLSGSGILVLAADYVEIQGNTIRGHTHAGLAVYSLSGDFSRNKVDVGIIPEYLSAHDNLYSDNKLDIDWDGTGGGNAFDERIISSNPGILPSSSWNKTFYRIYWHMVNGLFFS